MDARESKHRSVELIFSAKTCKSALLPRLPVSASVFLFGVFGVLFASLCVRCILSSAHETERMFEALWSIYRATHRDVG